MVIHQVGKSNPIILFYYYSIEGDSVVLYCTIEWQSHILSCLFLLKGKNDVCTKPQNNKQLCCYIITDHYVILYGV